MKKWIPKSECTWKTEQGRSFLKILTLVKIYAKVNILEIGAVAQFPSLKWRNGSQNQNVLKKSSKTGPFWKFWLFGQSQRSNLVKTPFFTSFFFFLDMRFGSGSKKGPGLKVRIDWRMMSEAYWECVRVWESGSAWHHMSACGCPCVFRVRCESTCK